MPSLIPITYFAHPPIHLNKNQLDAGKRAPFKSITRKADPQKTKKDKKYSEPKWRKIQHSIEKHKK